MKVHLIRYISHFTVILITLYFLINKIIKLNFSFNYLVWFIPYILIAILDIALLCTSLRKKPIHIDTRFSTFLIALAGSSGGIFTAMVIDYPPMDFLNLPMLKTAAFYLSLIPYPLTLWALLCLKTNLTVIPESHEFINSGIYKYSRHPMYVCYAIWILAGILMFPSLPFTGLSLAHFIMHLLRMVREEEVLLKTFPDYASYKHSVGVVGPFFKGAKP